MILRMQQQILSSDNKEALLLDEQVLWYATSHRFGRISVRTALTLSLFIMVDSASTVFHAVMIHKYEMRVLPSC